jgi:PPE-repeat protein
MRLSITALEADYGEMWAQDASVMYRYAGASAPITNLTAFAPPTLGDNSPGLMGPGADAGIPDVLAQAMAAVPRALRYLGQPTRSASATATMTTVLRLRPLRAPVGAFAAAISSAASMTSSGTSAAMSTKNQGWPEVKAAFGRGVVVGRLPVPPGWGEIAFADFRSIA